MAQNFDGGNGMVLQLKEYLPNSVLDVKQPPEAQPARIWMLVHLLQIWLGSKGSEPRSLLERGSAPATYSFETSSTVVDLKGQRYERATTRPIMMSVGDTNWATATLSGNSLNGANTCTQ